MRTYYAASGGEFNPKGLKYLTIASDVVNVSPSAISTLLKLLMERHLLEKCVVYVDVVLYIALSVP